MGQLGKPGRLFGSFKVQNREEFIQKTEDYLTRDDDRDIIKHPSAWDRGKFKPTLAGLSRALGIDKRTMQNYKKTEEYGDLVEEVKSIIEENLERGLYGQQVTGLIFNLKNNFGWRDKSEVEQSTKVVDDGEDEF